MELMSRWYERQRKAVAGDAPDRAHRGRGAPRERLRGG
jgi:hypothetical protein